MAKQNDLVTKQYFETRLENFKEEIIERVDSSNKKLLDEVTTIKVEILGRLDAKEEDNEVHSFSHQRLNDETSDHEVRISSLESKAKD